MPAREARARRALPGPLGAIQHALRDEHGSETLQVVLIVPLVLLAFFGGLHMTVNVMAQNDVQHIAVAACDEGRLYGANPVVTGTNVATALLDASSGLYAAHASGSATADTLTITVTAESGPVIPGLPVEVSHTAVCPIEDWVD